MRVDKYLAAARLLKKREHARELCEAGLVLVGGRPVKPAHRVAPGDEIRLELRRRLLVVRVTAIPGRSVARADRHLYHEIIEDRFLDDQPPADGG